MSANNFDEEEMRKRLSGNSHADLIDMLLQAYKDKRLLAKALDEAWKKLDRIKQIAEEPLASSAMQNNLTPDELRWMMEDDKDDRP